MRKLGARNRVEIAMWVYETGRLKELTSEENGTSPPSVTRRGQARCRQSQWPKWTGATKPPPSRDTSP